MALHWKALLMAAALLPFADLGLDCKMQISQRIPVWMAEDAVRNFRAECGRLPYSLEELSGPVAAPAACRGRVYSYAANLRDRFGYLHYWKSYDDTEFVVRSVGRDQVFGTADDYTSCHPRLGIGCPERGCRRDLSVGYGQFIALLVIPLLLLFALGSGLSASISQQMNRRLRVAGRWSE